MKERLIRETARRKLKARQCISCYIKFQYIAKTHVHDWNVVDCNNYEYAAPVEKVEAHWILIIDIFL